MHFTFSLSKLDVHIYAGKNAKVNDMIVAAYETEGFLIGSYQYYIDRDREYEAGNIRNVIFRMDLTSHKITEYDIPDRRFVNPLKCNNPDEFRYFVQDNDKERSMIVKLDFGK